MWKILNDPRCKVILYICAIRFPKYPSILFPFYMLIIYIQLSYRNKTYKLKEVPRELMKRLINKNVKNSYIDINNTVIVNDHVLKIIKIKNIAKLNIFGGSNRKSRLVWVVGLKIDHDTLLVCDSTSFNLKLTCNENKAKLIKINSNVKTASHVDISLVNTQHDIVNAVTDEILNNYFKTPKLLRKNDLIPIEVKLYCPKFYYTHNKIHEIDYIYFKCNKIRHEENFNFKTSFFCVAGESTLKQSANTQNYLIPSLKHVCMNDINESVDFNCCLINQCPNGLKGYFQEIEKCVQPFIDSSKYHFYMKYIY